jgi:hypothetical protein
MASARSKNRFAVCVNNEGYEASLEAGKLYQLVPDAAATARGYMRVVDESGEDYWYSVERFFQLDIPRTLADALAPARARRPARSGSGTIRAARS